MADFMNDYLRLLDDVDDGCEGCGDVEFKFKQKISIEVYKGKYKGKDKNVEETFRRVSKDVALVEKDKKKWEDEFFRIMSECKFIPGGRIVENAGNKVRNYINCFTIGIEDSMESIYTALLEDAMISKVGGGVGFDISELRPEDDIISKGGTSSGPISFLRVFNQSAKTIHTGGGRRAAHIALLDVSHPDIEKFITCKEGDKNKVLTQFNLSVKITDEFIDAVKKNKNWDLIFKGKVYKTIKARDLYNKLTEHAYIHNEPGIFNVDTVNRYNNGFYDFRIDQTNPCGEIPMPKYSICCLGSINLTSFMSDPFGNTPSFNHEEYKRTIGVAIRFLDNVLDRTEYPVEKIKDNSLKYRRVGLGFTGLGDVFAMLKMEYGSEESKKFSEFIGKELRDTSYYASIDLAKEKGKFPGFKKDIMKSEFIKKLPKEIRDRIDKDGLRNIGLNTCAPTGTTSIVFGNNCSSGIEPIIFREYERKIRTGKEDEYTTQKVEDYAWKIYKKTFPDSKEKVPSYFKVSSEIDPFIHVDIQSIFQKYIDHSISKTINLPNENFSIDDYKKLFMYAYDNEIKGFTTYNPNGSLKGIMSNRNMADRPSMINRSEAPIRPQDLPCEIHRSVIQDEEFIILVGLLNGMVYEIFAGRWKGNEDIEKYKSGIIRKIKKGCYDLVLQDENTDLTIKDLSKCFTVKDYNTCARLVSMALRHGTPLEFVCNQLHKDPNFLSFEKAIARVIKKYITDGEIVKSSMECPACEERTFVFESGCHKCISCGWTACS